MNFLPSTIFLAALAALAALLAALPAAPAGAAPAPASAAAAGSAPAGQPLRCDSPAFGRDKLTVVCKLAAAAPPQRVHIKVHFTGSHDDTTASMEVAVGGAIAVCDAGSKTSTEAEEGEVTLDCSFTAPAGAGEMRASAKWFHAQYVDLEINGRRP